MIDVLYMAGSGRSGSTLLERILGQLDDCVVVGELRHLWRRDPQRELCGCGQLLASCPFWTAVFDKAFGGFDRVNFADMRSLQLRVDRMRYLPQLVAPATRTAAFTGVLRAYGDVLQRLYSAIVEVSRCSRIIDSSKDISTLYLLAALPEYRLRVVQMVRDSRAVAYSWMRLRVRPHVVDEVSYMPVYSPVKSALDWDYRNVLAERVAGRVHGYLRLRYEDLISNPEASIAQVISLLEIEQAEAGLVNGPVVDLKRDSHTVSGNPMRFEKGSIQLRLDREWQDEMAPANKQTVTLLTWPLLRHYGYT